MLMNKYLENIKNNVNVRQSVIELKIAVRSHNSGKALAQMLAGDFSVLTDLLRHEDPKVRKNAALVLGELEEESVRDILWDAYQREEILFARADYLKALSHYDCTPYLDAIKERMRFLETADIAPDEQKHYYEEQTAIKTVLRKNEKHGKHKFIGYHRPVEIILMTNREQREATIRQIRDAKEIRMLAGGVRLVTEKLHDILPIRTYSELLFPLPGCPLLEGSPGHIAKQMIAAGLITYLKELHESAHPFYFRLDIKSAMPEDRRVDLLKKLAMALEMESAGQLYNAPGGYEIEVRLVANKAGRFLPLLKLYTIHDYRFAYRKESLPTSIAPVNAALIMELAKDYLTQDAAVLDPFCGAGTMLAERAFCKPAGYLYGIDIMGDAIAKARENAQAARIKINFINRDFFDFTHKYLFDEIITNLPAAGRTRDAAAILELYDRFLERAARMVRKGAVIIAYAASYSVLQEAISRHREYRLLHEFCLNEREGSSAAVLKYDGTT